MKRLATIIKRDVGAKGIVSRFTGQPYPPVIRAFFLDEEGDCWAVPPDQDRSALSRVGECVEIEIHCTDDQYAYPVTRLTYRY